LTKPSELPDCPAGRRFAAAPWFAVLVAGFSLSICKSNLRDLDFFDGVIGPVENGVISKNEHLYLYLPTNWISLDKVTPAMGIATESPEQPNQLVALLRAPFSQEFEHLPPQIDLILHRI
jgi:hypothetical protein